MKTEHAGLKTSGPDQEQTEYCFQVAKYAG